MANLVKVRLAEPNHRMPDPFNPALDFPADGKLVDVEDPVWMQLINDGSLVVVPAPAKKSIKET
ncbi:hypothetical protein [Aminobacter niigataensis]|uniref:hypothetical protein n=1 Tax=Aminobacter niigataensis TaxID=83265 RepID=UPI0024C97E88|nr:hypothetical protein [Aminobacter niigataensis]CAI2936154.1 conserved protein of unknown function [Aminobacter niigataensis]